MALLTTWPAYTDDTGTKTDGTIVDASLLDSIKSAIAADIQSATNPSVAPKTITDEVITARGSKANLDARLDVAINEDGTLKAIAGQASTTELGELAGANNWVINDDFLIWAAGDAVAPTFWALSGAGAAAARTGTGLGDTNTKVGPYSVKLTRAAADVKLTQFLLNATSFANFTELKGQPFTAGVWAKTSVSNHARITISDGIVASNSSYHTGGGDWEFLTVQATLDSSADRLLIRFEVNGSSGDAYFSGATAMPGSVGLQYHVPTMKQYGFLQFKVSGTVTTGDAKDYSYLARPGLMTETVLRVGTAPTGQALIVDFDRFDGSGWASPYSTRPQIAAGAASGTAKVDGTYKNRCVEGGGGLNSEKSLMRFNVDQVGSGVAGSNLMAILRIMQYATPQEGRRSTDDNGIA